MATPLNSNLVAQLRARLSSAASMPMQPQLQPTAAQSRKSIEGMNRDELHQLMMSMVDAEPWDYYDTAIFSANVVAPATAAVNFANITSPIPFFSGRTIGNAGASITSMSDTGKTDADFFCTRITVDVSCDTDVASSANNVATSAAFVEAIVNYGVVVLTFGTNTKLLWPVIKAPSGGGVVQGAKVRTLAIAATTDSAAATNGLQLSTAAKDLETPIFFKEGTAFTAQIALPQGQGATGGVLSRIQAFAPLTGNLQASIRLNFEGVRGRALLPGSR